MQSSFIPHFESLKKENPALSIKFFLDFFAFLSLMLILFVLVIELLLWPFGHSVIGLFLWMLPGLIFVCLYALNSAFLQCQKHFFLPALAPIFFNLVWIAGCFLLRELYLLSFCVTIAFLAQWIATIPSCLKELSSFKLKITPFSKEVRTLFKPLFLSIIGISALQINSALDAIFAKIADPSGPAYLWYAMRLYQLPLSLFGIALSASLLPMLSRCDKEEYRSLFQRAFTLNFAFMIPICCFFFALGGPLLNFLFGRGDFSPHSTIETLHCFWAYNGGLVFSTGVLFLSSAFYAKKNLVLPTRGAIWSVAINVSLNAFFIFVLKTKSLSIALATSLSSLFNFVYLAYLLNKKEEKLISLSIGKITASGVAAASGVLLFSAALHIPVFSSLPREFYQQSLHLALLSSIFIVLLFLFAKLFHCQEILSWLELVRVRKKLADKRDIH